MSGAYDDLFVGRTWLDSLTEEARAEVDEIVEACVDHDSEPVWSQVWVRFSERFPGQQPKSDTTFRENIRKLVAERG